MPPERILAQLGVESLSLRSVVGRFYGGRLTTDRGGMPREVDGRFRVRWRGRDCGRRCSVLSGQVLRVF